MAANKYLPCHDKTMSEVISKMVGASNMDDDASNTDDDASNMEAYSQLTDDVFQRILHSTDERIQTVQCNFVFNS